MDPITLFEGKVLDGRNRLRACQEAGGEPQFVEFTGSDPAAFVMSKNVTRRHLKPSQKAMVVAKMKKFITRLQAQSKKRSLNNLKKGTKSPIPSRDGIGTDAVPDEEGVAATDTPQPEPAQATNKHKNTTAAKLGKVARVSESTVERAKYVYDQGTPEDIQEVESGEKSVSKKAKEIRERKAPKKDPQNQSRAKTEGVAGASENAFVITVKDCRIKEYLQDLMHVANRCNCGKIVTSPFSARPSNGAISLSKARSHFSVCGWFDTFSSPYSPGMLMITRYDQSCTDEHIRPLAQLDQKGFSSSAICLLFAPFAILDLLLDTSEGIGGGR